MIIKPESIPSMPAPGAPGYVHDDKQREQLEKFVAAIGPRGLIFVDTSSNEHWRHTGLNALIGYTVLHTADGRSRARSKASDWLYRFRAVRSNPK
jgi:hypothetical protein